MNGVEEVGGLRIVRAPTRPPSASQPTSNPHTEDIPLHSNSQPLPAPQRSSSKPPSKKFRASPSPFPSSNKPQSQTSRKKDRDLLSTTREEPEVDADVRRMEDETDSLRRQSQSQSQSQMLLGEGLNPAFNFPGPGAGATAPKKRTREKTPKFAGSTSGVVDSIQELSQGDTPQMARNKLMREGKLPSQQSSSQLIGSGAGGSKDTARAGKGHTRRKSSMIRGKRVSGLIEGGIICEY